MAEENSEDACPWFGIAGEDYSLTEIEDEMSQGGIREFKALPHGCQRQMD
jgi:hypothetical protein